MFFCLIILSVVLGGNCQTLQESSPSENNSLIFVSTLDGRFRAIDSKTGTVKWVLEESPLLSAPATDKKGFTFVPNPQDGSLYVLRDGQLQKFPYSIPYLVEKSPCTSTTDNTLYSGRKHGTWLTINLTNGHKLETLSAEQNDKMCLASHENVIRVAKTDYTLAMFDSSSGERKWNATFTHFSAPFIDFASEDEPYQYRFYSSSSDGRFVTVNANSEELLWERNLGTPIVAVYVLKRGGLHQIGLNVFGKDTLNAMFHEIIDDDNNETQNPRFADNSRLGMDPNLFETVFVGQNSDNGLYAITSHVDQNTLTFRPKSTDLPLLDGPSPIQSGRPSADSDHPARNGPEFYVDSERLGMVNDGQSVVLLGHYATPPVLPHKIDEISDLTQQPIRRAISHIEPPASQQGDSKSKSKIDQIASSNVSGFITYEPNPHGGAGGIHFHFTAYELQLLVTLMIVLVVTLVTLGVTLRRRALNYADMSTSSVASSQMSAMQMAPVALRGWIPVGKIMYNTDDVLGIGAGGTVVYRGKFDNRDVAVKCVLAEFFTLADREASLLRESDSHSHVIRYHCMEADSRFRYIALELCMGTVEDYVTKTELRSRVDITVTDVVQQALMGLAFLHSLNFVHRDIKPHNVLISMPSGADNRVRIVISDFGLCKRISTSFSQKSSMAGTDGWIAPEIMNGEKITCKADIFSMGCVMYYVLSGGKHPFGESFQRQINIVYGKFDLGIVKDDRLVTVMIETMLNLNPAARPSAAALLKFPYLWLPARKLAFFQDVSDRIEKEENDHEVCRALESRARHVVRGDWRAEICINLQADLRKFRTYKGSSVRDLLRAMRNKKHHYRELPVEVQESLGVIPEGFLEYFTGRFRCLLLHVFLAVEKCCVDESPLDSYYDASFRWHSVAFDCSGSVLESLEPHFEDFAFLRREPRLERPNSKRKSSKKRPAAVVPSQASVDENWRKKAEIG